jgi:hypothetical protein
VFASPANSAVPDPYEQAASVITCPAGPAGWSVPSGSQGRFVLTPMTVSGGSENEAPIAYGGRQVNVDCTYWTDKGGRLTVSARYALPSHFNPYADFYIGCRTKGSVATQSKAWDTKDRVFRVVSPKSWSYATFYDAYAQLSGSEASAFQAIARTMLTRAEPIAHDCKLSLTETGPLKLWTFGFNAKVKKDGLTTTGSTSGTFFTRPNASGGTGQLGQLNANPIVLKIRKGTKLVGKVTLLVTQPLSFKYSYGAELRAEVKVTATTYAPCNKGAKGTLMVSTNTRTASLQVCDRNALQGTGATNAHISE